MLIAALVSAAVMAAASPPSTPMDDIAGDWVTADRSAVVRLFACDEDAERLCGNMIWIQDPAWVEETFVGGEIITDFSFRQGAWRQGRLTNPGDGNVYRGSIRLQDASELQLKGCALRILCKSETWSRLGSLSTIGAALDDFVMDQLPSDAQELPSP